MTGEQRDRRDDVGAADIPVAERWPSEMRAPEPEEQPSTGGSLPPRSESPADVTVSEVGVSMRCWPWWDRLRCAWLMLATGEFRFRGELTNVEAPDAR